MATTGPFLSRDYTHYAQLETAYEASPGALTGADAFKCQTEFPFERVKARLDRDKDSGPSASVISTQGGRESSTWKIEGDLIPSDNATTPTPPDMSVFFEGHFGTKHTATAHTTTAAGSVGAALNLAVGGGASSGLQVGDLVAIDVSADVGYEVRQIVALAGDVATLDRPLTDDPAAGRAVKTGTTYSFLAEAVKTLHIWEFLQGDYFRHKTGGCIPRQMTLGCDFTEDVPVASIAFEGDGAIITAQNTTAEPVALTAGLPLVPMKSYVWFDEDKHCLCKVELTSDNGNELRNNTSCTLTPSGVKKTGNGGRYSVELDLGLLLETGVIESYFDEAGNLVPYSIMVQLGTEPGSICAFTAPKYIPDSPIEAIDGEVAVGTTGRCYGTAGDDELFLAFL